MIILGIDPGPEMSGWCLFDAASSRVVRSVADARNDHVLDMLLLRSDANMVAIEMIASYGMPVGREVFETCVWIGRFVQAWASSDVRLIARRDITLGLCGSVRAKDGNVRQALIDRLGPHGTKRSPGPTYGVSGHAWQALAVAITFADQLAGNSARIPGVAALSRR